MKRRLILAIWLAIGAIYPISAQLKYAPIITATDCLVPACTLAVQQCRNTGTASFFLCDPVTHHYVAIVGGAAGNPGGSDKQINFNDGGAFNGDPGLTYDKATDFLTVAGGYSRPARIGTNYTMANPTLAPTVVSQPAVAGTCLSSRQYRGYVVWVNESGMTIVGPASSPDVTPTNLKRITITRSESPPSNATGWIAVFSGSNDAHATKVDCSGVLATGTTSFDCGCTGASPAYAGSNTTGFRRTIGLDVTPGVIDFSTFGGGIQNPITEAAHTLDGTTSALKYDGNALALVSQLPIPVRVVTICASGCQYTTISAAVAANTSTAANPIQFLVGPGIYSGKVTFAGQDHATFQGAGIGSTIITCTESGAPADGCFEPGTSTNWTFTGFTVQGKINASMANVGGGLIRVIDNEFIAPSSLGSHDGIYWDQPVTGSRIFAQGNYFDLSYNADGLACDRLCSNADWYYSGNTIISRDPRGSEYAVRFNSIPCNMVSQSETIHMDGGASAGSALSLAGFLFESDYGGSGDCSGTARAFITGTNSYINNRSSGLAGSSAFFAYVTPSATALDELHIEGTQAFTTTTDATNVGTQGVVVGTSGAGIVTTITGSRIQSQGGTSGYDINTSGSPVNVWGTRCQSETGSPIRGQHCGPLIDAPTKCNIGDSYVKTDGNRYTCSATDTWTSPTVALDTDLVTIGFIPPGGDYQLEQQLNNRKWWGHSSGSGALSNFAVWDLTTDHRWEAASTSSIIGPEIVRFDYTGKVLFQGAPIASYTASDALSLNTGLTIDTGPSTPVVTVGGNAVVTGTTTLGTLLHMTCVSVLPGMCAQGDVICKTDGAFCQCYATNSWQQIGSQGVCM